MTGRSTTALGSLPDLNARNGEVRLTSMSRHRQRDRLRPKGAMKRLMHRSNYLLYSIT